MRRLPKVIIDQVLNGASPTGMSVVVSAPANSLYTVNACVFTNLSAVAATLKVGVEKIMVPAQGAIPTLVHYLNEQHYSDQHPLALVNQTPAALVFARVCAYESSLGIQTLQRVPKMYFEGQVQTEQNTKTPQITVPVQTVTTLGAVMVTNTSETPGKLDVHLTKAGQVRSPQDRLIAELPIEPGTKVLSALRGQHLPAGYTLTVINHGPTYANLFIRISGFETTGF